MHIDAELRQTKWSDACILEIQCLHDYEVFRSNGKVAPSGYKKIRIHLVFEVKHDGRHRARLVADGHLTLVPAESVYSGVVSLRGVRIVTFLAELNKIEMWATTDIGSAYLESYTKEKLYIKAGPEFGELEGHYLIIVRALYGLRTSGVRWHERFADCLMLEGFFPCKAEPDIWMRDAGDAYEYVAVYVDDLAFVVKDPKAFEKTLIEKYKFKLKGTGPITFHLGCDFIRDSAGTLRLKPESYIKRLVATYERHFGAKTTPTRTPLEPILRWTLAIFVDRTM